MKRQRGRGRRSGGGNNNNPNKHFESNGPDVKIRGSAQQILDKYQQYARDAQSSGDRVNAENYLQHAEHYYRVLAAMKPPEKPKQEPREGDAKEGDAAATEGRTDAKADGDDTQKREPREGGRGRGRGRGRRDREDNKDKSEDATTGETDTKADAETSESPVEVETVEASPVEEKPKRRRTYKKREPEAAASEQGDDGIMKTLSRGRKKAEPAAEVEASAADVPVAED